MDRARSCLAHVRMRADLFSRCRSALWVFDRISLDAGTLRVATRNRVYGRRWIYAVAWRARQRRHRLRAIYASDKGVGRYFRNTPVSSALDGGAGLDVVTIRSRFLVHS